MKLSLMKGVVTTAFFAISLFGCDSSGNDSSDGIRTTSTLSQQSFDHSNIDRMIAAASGNRLVNGDFNPGGGGWMTCSGDAVTYQSQPNQALVGSEDCIMQGVEVRVGETLQLQCRAKRNVGRRNKTWSGMNLSFYDANGNFISEPDAAVINATNSAETYTVSAVVPAGASRAGAWVYSVPGAIVSSCVMSDDGGSEENTFTFADYGTLSTFMGVDLNNSGKAIWLNNNTLNIFENGGARVIDNPSSFPNFQATSLNSSGDVAFSVDLDLILYADGQSERLIYNSDQTFPLNLKLANNGVLTFTHLSRVFDSVINNFRLENVVYYRDSGGSITQIANATNTAFSSAMFAANESGSVVWADLETRQISLFDGSSTREISVPSQADFAQNLPAIDSDSENKRLAVNDFNVVAWIGSSSGGAGVFVSTGPNTNQIASLDSGLNNAGYVNINNSGQVSWVDGSRVIQYSNGTVRTIYESSRNPGVTNLKQNNNGDLGWADSMVEGEGSVGSTGIYTFRDGVVEKLREVFGGSSFVLLNNSGEVAFNDTGTFTVATPGDGGSNDGSIGRRIRLNQWVSGYIATFECAIDRNAPDSVLIDFNYTGGGVIDTSWLLTYIGETEDGNFGGSDNSYAIRTTGIGYQPLLQEGQSVLIEILVRNAVFSDSDYNVRCSTE